ncbi:MAG: DUF5320 domain-containing protein [Candidatus Hydrothermia bacterium]
MPFGDGTGPFGMGPGTGRRMGFCHRYNSSGCTKPWPRLGSGKMCGFSFGSAFGSRRSFHPFCRDYPDISPSSEKEILMEQAKFLENQLKAIKERIEKLENE